MIAAVGAPLLTAAANAASTGGAGGAEEIVFWIVGPLALIGALAMVFARGAVHSALWLVLTMMCLGVLYITQQAEFLGFAQIIVYTGAIMMLFLFVLMLTGRDAGDSVVEVLRGQRVIAGMVGLGVVGLLVAVLVQALGTFPDTGLSGALAERGAIGSLAALIFTNYLFPFELTSALLITAAVGAMVLAHVEKARGEKHDQRRRVLARMRSDRMSPRPGPGVLATSNSNATPALLPDGSVAPGSVSPLVDQTESERVVRRFRAGRVVNQIEAAEHPWRAPEGDDGPGEARGTAGDGGPADHVGAATGAATGAGDRAGTEGSRS